MTEPVIRPAARADLEQILALYRDLSPGDPELGASAAAAIWDQLIASATTTVLVAALGDQLVSTCSVSIVPNLTRGGRPYAWIENVVTRSDQRRRGLGKAVLSAALDRAWAADCYKVMLATGSRRPETLRFYEAAGFARDAKTFFEVRRR